MKTFFKNLWLGFKVVFFSSSPSLGASDQVGGASTSDNDLRPYSPDDRNPGGEFFEAHGYVGSDD